MKKKVIDIFPPKGLEKKAIKESKWKEVYSLSEKESQPRKFRISLPFAGRKILVLGLPILILISFFGYFTLSKAYIEVWPEVETLTFKTGLTIDEEADYSDFEAKVIPGENFEKEKTVSENFPSSGKVLKEANAEGIIKVYNDYSTYSQALMATTRFVSADGKLFRTPNRVTIPGGHYEKGKFIPGDIDIKVVADQPGPEYNIGPSTFSIPGFAGTDKYTKFYAKSFQAMKGGFSKEVSQVTKEDLEKAEEVLTKRVKKESEDSFKNKLETEKISSEIIFLEEAIRTEIVESFSLAKIKKEVEYFNFQVKAKSETIIFKKEDLENFVKEFIISQISKRKKLYEESLKINYSPETINLNSGKIILSLEISAKIYSDIDTSLFKNSLKGKSLIETKILLGDQPEITKVKVKFWPFWVKKIPEDTKKIKFKLNLE